MTTTTAPTELSAELRDHLDRIEALKRDAHALVDALTDEQVNWRPDPTRWSVAQCLNHIVLSGRPYAAGLGGLAEEARLRERQGHPPLRPGFFANWFIRSMEPPPRLKVKTFRAMEPVPSTFTCDAVLAEFVAFHDELAERVRALNGVNLNGARMSSPFFRPLRFTIGQVLAMLVAHARRHLWQARQVRRHPGFPG